MRRRAAGIVLVWSALSIPSGRSAAQAPETDVAVGVVAGPPAGRDPFAAPMSTSAERLDVSPLERFTLSELRLVATVNGVDPPRALIEDPGGQGFITVAGNMVGAEQHQIVTIGRGEVVLEIPASGDVGSASRVIMKLGESGKAGGE